MNYNNHYWNTNSTTRIRPEVVEELKRYIDSNNDINFHNPSDIYNTSKILYYNVIFKAKSKFLEMVNGDNSKDNVIITSGGSESNSLALSTGARFVGKKGLIVVSAVEHDSILLGIEKLKREGYNVIVIGVNEKGQYNVDEIKEISTSVGRRVFLSMMLVNNELGNIYDIAKISEIARNRWGESVIIHTDAVQAFGKMKIDVKDLGIDMLSVSGHKIGAPKGIGALYVKQNTEIEPIVFGHQECMKRGGTENIPYIAAFLKAMEITELQMSPVYTNIISEHRDSIEKGFQNICKKLGLVCKVIGDTEHRVANTSCLYIKGIINTNLVLAAAAKSIYFSTGAACNSSPCLTKKDNDSDTKPSNVIKAIGHKDYKGVLRISVGDELFNYELTEINFFSMNEKDICSKLKAFIKLEIQCLSDIKTILERIK